MDIIQVPNATRSQQQITAGPVSFVNYCDKGSLFRNRVVFNRYAFSFVQNGQKQIYRLAEHTVLKAGHGMLIPEGHSIIAEHSFNTEPYHSVIIFFPGDLAREFVARHLPATHQTENIPPYIHFSTNTYLNEYIQNLRKLIEAGEQLSETVAIHKLHELLLVMTELYPEQLQSMLGSKVPLPLKKLIENNLFNGLSLDELAFLANRSISSFKRDFEKLYGLSPMRYIRERKLELAANDLLHGKNPSELYLVYGYENLSNFNTAFKKKYGQPPAAYRHSLTL